MVLVPLIDLAMRGPAAVAASRLGRPEVDFGRTAGSPFPVVAVAKIGGLGIFALAAAKTNFWASETKSLPSEEVTQSSSPESSGLAIRSFSSNSGPMTDR